MHAHKVFLTSFPPILDQPEPSKESHTYQLTLNSINCCLLLAEDESFLATKHTAIAHGIDPDRRFWERTCVGARRA